MTDVTGRLLVATPSLSDPNFSRSVVAILEHDGDGSVGVIINRATDIDVLDYLPWLDDVACDPQVVFVGGPVQRETAIGIHRTERGVPAIVESLEEPPGHPMRVFSGYAGWGPGQLAAELDEGSWIVADQHESDAFDPDPATLWKRVLQRQPGRVAMLATYPIDLSSN